LTKIWAKLLPQNEKEAHEKIRKKDSSPKKEEKGKPAQVDGDNNEKMLATTHRSIKHKTTNKKEKEEWCMSGK